MVQNAHGELQDDCSDGDGDDQEHQENVRGVGGGLPVKELPPLPTPSAAACNAELLAAINRTSGNTIRANIRTMLQTRIEAATAAGEIHHHHRAARRGEGLWGDGPGGGGALAAVARLEAAAALWPGHAGARRARAGEERVEGRRLRRWRRKGFWT